jgi:CubicO group peptidase (beta-lactamase class C family)
MSSEPSHPMARRILVGLGLLLLALFAIAPSRTMAQGDLPLARPETVGMSAKRLERVQTFIQDYIDTNQIAGAVTLVARKGKVVHFEAQGWRVKEDQQPMQKDTIFSLASMTKPIVSAALMMLWEDGKFMLDDPIAKWLPSYGVRGFLFEPLLERDVSRRT